MRTEHRTSLLNYADALQHLDQDPNNPVYQHRAVLALARAGSLTLAISEYERYGLDKIGDLQDAKLLEDIMALGGRLFKDLALANTGRARKNFAGQSSGKYDAAFKRTSGYYSGINAATMALMAGFPNEMVQDRAMAILNKLPKAEFLTDEDRYYIEATRAEAFLLLGDLRKAGAILNSAIEYDPQNYAAHATTIKQFRMILEEIGKPTDWLEMMRPPQVIHFAGHMFTDKAQGVLPFLSEKQINTLNLTLSDTIQREDIGFGYGALAAGSDILIAEALLAEGCGLHVVLPVKPAQFRNISVAPYGEQWVKRFNLCLEKAASLTVTGLETPWPDDVAISDTSIRAMGDAILLANSLAVPTMQLLISDGQETTAGTGADKHAWARGGRNTTVIEYPGERAKKTTKKNPFPPPYISRSQADQEGRQSFDSMTKAINAALDYRKNNPEVRQGLDFNALGQKEISDALSSQLAQQAVPGSILLSAAFAARITLWHSNAYKADFVGTTKDQEKIFALGVNTP